MKIKDYSFGIDKRFLSRLRFTYCDNIFEEHGEIKTLDDVTLHIPQAYRQEIESLRATTSPEDYQIQKERLPVWYPGGIFFGKHTTADRVVGNPIICIDVDGKQNPGVPVATMKERAANSPYVFYAGESCGGKGIYMLIPLPDDYKEETRFKGYFRAIAEYWAAAGIIIDPSGCNFNRARFLSIDDRPVINKLALVWREYKPAPEDTPAPVVPSRVPAAEYSQYLRVEAIVSQCEDRGIDLAPERPTWYGLAASLANGLGEDGRGFFLRLSKVWEDTTGRTQMDDPSATFDRALKRGRAPFDYFFHLAKFHGVLANTGKFRRVHP